MNYICDLSEDFKELTSNKNGYGFKQGSIFHEPGFDIDKDVDCFTSSNKFLHKLTQVVYESITFKYDDRLIFVTELLIENIDEHGFIALQDKHDLIKNISDISDVNLSSSQIEKFFNNIRDNGAYKALGAENHAHARYIQSKLIQSASYYCNDDITEYKSFYFKLDNYIKSYSGDLFEQVIDNICHISKFLLNSKFSEEKLVPNQVISELSVMNTEFDDLVIDIFNKVPSEALCFL